MFVAGFFAGPSKIDNTSLCDDRDYRAGYAFLDLNAAVGELLKKQLGTKKP